MAIMKDGKISGSIANITWYTSNGKDIMRSKPGKGKVKQVEITKINASNFGRATKMVNPLLNELSKELNFRMLPSNRGKTIGAVSKWLSEEAKLTKSAYYSFPTLIELNDLVTLEKSVKIKTEVSLTEDNTIIVAYESFIPTSAVIAPKKIYSFEMKAVLVITRNKKDVEREENLVFPASLNIIYTDEKVAAQSVSFPVKPIAGTNFMVCLVVSYEGNFISGMEKERKWLPAGVLGVGKIV